MDLTKETIPLWILFILAILLNFYFVLYASKCVVHDSSCNFIGYILMLMFHNMFMCMFFLLLMPEPGASSAILPSFLLWAVGVYLTLVRQLLLLFLCISRLIALSFSLGMQGIVWGNRVFIFTIAISLLFPLGFVLSFENDDPGYYYDDFMAVQWMNSALKSFYLLMSHIIFCVLSCISLLCIALGALHSLKNVRDSSENAIQSYQTDGPLEPRVEAEMASRELYHTCFVVLHLGLHCFVYTANWQLMPQPTLHDIITHLLLCSILPFTLTIYFMSSKLSFHFLYGSNLLVRGLRRGWKRSIGRCLMKEPVIAVVYRGDGERRDSQNTNT